MYRRSLQCQDQAVNQELDRVAVAMAQPTDYLALQTLYASPSRYFDGMLVLADGTTWNPGSGAGPYARVAGAWKYLGGGGGGGGSGTFDMDCGNAAGASVDFSYDGGGA